MRRFLAGLVVVLTVTCTGGAAHAQYGGSGDVPGGATPPDEVLGEVISRNPIGGTTPADDVLGEDISRTPSGLTQPAGGDTEVLGISFSRGSLVRTGQELLPYVVASASLIGLGAALVVASRRRGTVVTAF